VSLSASSRLLQTLPNVGPAVARDLIALGITAPGQLKSCDPFKLYDRLCELRGMRIDPCMLDTFMAVVDFAKTGKPRPWWSFTAERKRMTARREIQGKSK